jgi:formylglycine-generating enzyme required for sulfatase activity
VGNAGNAVDTRYATPGYGSVASAYRIGKFEVTAGQYTEFLNAVAKTDTYGLYSTSMWSSSTGCSIRQTGGSGNYTYLVDANGDGIEDGDWANRPVNYVSYWDACRFSNWLNNGQATGAQNASTTEDGSYTLNGYTGDDGRTIQRNANARWVVPSEDEWYKAAYHENDGVTGNYWNYPTGTSAVPNNGNPEADTGNSANFYDGDYTIGSPYWRTPAGYFGNSDSPYGTFDQGGNVWEWNDSVVYEYDTWSERGRRDGSFGQDSHAALHLHASNRSSSAPMNDSAGLGFRVAEVPEPATGGLFLVGGLILARRRRALR